MMKAKALLCIVTITGLCTLSLCHTRQYHFVYEKRNWTDSQQYCREKFTDLATIDSVEDVKTLNDMVDLQSLANPDANYGAWIGLYGDVSWRWSLAGERFYRDAVEQKFRKWGSGQPNNGAGLCTVMDSNGEWHDYDCAERSFAVCFKDIVCTTDTKADIVFLVDGSGSIGADNFQKVRQFIHSFTDGLDIGSDKVRVGLAQYSDVTYQEFLLKDHTDKRSLLQQVDRLPYRGGNTATGKGITFLLTHYFTKEAGSRADERVPQIAVVITDGESSDDVVGPSQLLRKQGAIVFAIGVGSFNEDQLKSIANQPHEQFLFKIDSFQALQKMTEVLLSTVCASVSALANCEKQADLVMLIDQSSSIDPNDYTVMKKFMTDLVDNFNVSEEFVRVGVAQFSSSPRKEFYLNEFYNAMALNNQILAMSQLGEGRNVGRALAFIQDYFQASRGSRNSQSISQTLVLITDGRSQDDVEDAAANLRAQGIEVLAIGVGDPDDLALLNITGSSERLFTVQNFSSLANIKQKVVNTICNSTHFPGRPGKFTLIEKLLTWDEAQRYCRENYTDLASVRNHTEHEEIQNIKGQRWSWIGLFRDSWKWSDGSGYSFRDWNTGEPNGPKEKCVSLEFGSGSKWADWNCERICAFICYSNVQVKKQVVRIKLSKTNSSLDLNNPAVQEAILEQFKQSLKDKGETSDIKLRWVKQSDGKIFHKDDKKNREKKKRERKPVLTKMEL